MVTTLIVLTDAERKALAEQEEAHQEVLRQYDFLTEKVGQLAYNIERAEREGTTGRRALDWKSPDNAGKTQYEIDLGLKQGYDSQSATLVQAEPWVPNYSPD